MANPRQGGDRSSKQDSGKHYVDANGDICIGDDCITVRARKGSRDIEIDLTGCPTDVQKQLKRRLIDGGETKFTVKAE